MFTLLHQCPHTRARRGRLRTAHGDIQTPAFMPVGTLGAVKAVTNRDLEELGADVILGNTYHLMLRPGLEGMRRLGGLHRFMDWKRPILTDSGGFQVFSLAKIRRLTDEGAEFRSHVDGTLLWLGPKEAIQMQQAIGSDIMMVLDECPPWDAPRLAMEAAVARTLKWATECRAHLLALSDKLQKNIPTGTYNFVESGSPETSAPTKNIPTGRYIFGENGAQLLFGIVQGGSHADLRKKCANGLQEIGFDGYAIGGVSVGEPEPEMFAAIEASVPYLPMRKPRYAMGLGHPHQLVEMVAQGVDMFDCVLPTRMARHGSAYTMHGPLDIRHARYQFDNEPLEKDCTCSTCQRYSRAYLRHLFKVHELTVFTLISLHNLHFYLNLMRNIRNALEINNFQEFRRSFQSQYGASNQT